MTDISFVTAKLLQLGAVFEHQQHQIDELQAEKNDANWERNALVAALSHLFPAVRVADRDNGEWRIVYITLPTGQVSWRIHKADDDLFRHLPVVAGVVWDGHTTEEKYARLAALRRQ